MDTKWNSIDRPEPAEALSPEARRFWRRRRVKGAAGFLAFALGASLVISSLGALGDRIAWERDPAPFGTGDWQETDAFRQEVSSRLRVFLTIGAGGEVDFYDYSSWEDYYGDAVVEQEEAYRFWWGFGETTEAVAIDRGTAEPDLAESVPGERMPEKERDPDADYRADKNVLYYIQGGGDTLYSNVDGNLSKLLARSVEGYNFYVLFKDNKVTITKDGENLDVYGNGFYDGDSQWFVPGYENFPVSEQLEDVKVIMAVRREPICYYSTDYQTGGTRYYSSFYNICRQVEESRAFYRTQAMLLSAGLACLLLWFVLRKSTEPVNRKIASWTLPVWTEIRFLIGLVLAVSLFGGLVPGELYYGLRDAVIRAGGYGDLWVGLVRLMLSHIPELTALFWLCWLIHNDHKYNPREDRRSLLRPFLRQLCARDLKRPVEKRLSRRGTLLALAVLLLGAETLWCMIVLSSSVGWDMFWAPWTLLLLPVLLAAAAVSLFQRCQGGLARDLSRLADQVEAVRSGDLSKPLVLPEDADLRRTAEALNDIQAGMRAALEEQTRSERMKVELVSNVSHDLKTPLTSILSYAELLRQEEDLPPAAADYARIIDEKAQRLKGMVEDVFEISKAAADQLPVHLERLDLGKLLRQTLADLDGPIRESALTFKVDLPETPVMITADGKRLYRVFQNLIDNALRYALAGSRVYLTLRTAAGMAEASVRNTSRSELPEGVDFTARFVRGDVSRTDGGSGLGLSIARSFTEACGGRFRVETVADLFTAVASFPIVE